MRRAGHAAAPAGAAAESIFLSEDGLRFLLNVTEEETIIEDDEKEMIASIFELGDKLVREVMVPRIDVASVPADLPMLAALDVILKAGHSRIPVYSNSVDNVIGVLYAKDLSALPPRWPDRRAAGEDPAAGVFRAGVEEGR